MAITVAPITDNLGAEIGDIDLSKGGEEVFRQGMSLVWKKKKRIWRRS